MALVASPIHSLPFRRGGHETRGPTIRELSETLRRIGVDEIPLALELSEEDLPALKDVQDESDQSMHCNLPLIDFSLLLSDRAKLSKQMGDAARSWGSCQIINHGISLEHLQHLIAESYKYFELPAERKQQTKSFIGDNTSERMSSLHWAESWLIHGTGPRSDLDAKVSSAWPEGNESFREAIAKYVRNLGHITKELFQLYAEDLGLESSFFSQHVNASELSIRLNYYPVCPQPSTVLGAKSHTDPNLVTILLQDKVGGLQVEKDGHWFDVRPIDGALVVNISDGFHVWTNGMYRTVLHRVLVNRNSHRLSLAGLWNLDDSTMYNAPDELVNESHPRLYKPIRAGDYKQNLIQTRSKADMSRTNQKEHSKLLKGLEQLNKWKLHASNSNCDLSLLNS